VSTPARKIEPQTLASARRLVVKVGSTLLVDEAKGDIRRTWLDALADDIAPVVILAVGRVASPEQLDTPFLEREVSVRQRHPLSELVLFGLD